MHDTLASRQSQQQRLGRKQALLLSPPGLYKYGHQAAHKRAMHVEPVNG